MSELPVHFQRVSREVIQQLAPNEVDLFDEMWMDFSERPSVELLGAGLDTQEMRAGGIELSLTSALLIPVVVQILSHGVKLGVDAVKDALVKRYKEKSQPLSDEQARAMADVIVKVIQQVSAADKPQAPGADKKPQ